MIEVSFHTTAALSPTRLVRRDAGRDNEFTEQVIDFYLIQFWATPPAPDTILASRKPWGAQSFFAALADATVRATTRDTSITT